MMRFKLGISLAAALTVALPPSRTAAQSSQPTRVILFIADGAGASYWTAARLAKDDLAIRSFAVGGLVDTRNSEGKITDSAAGATAYSAGIRTFNGAIAVGPDSTPATTVLEVARDRGLATGLVATSSITHATPASFAAHVPSRRMEFEIASQLVESGVQVMLGGGLQFFSPETREDGADILSDLRERYAVITRGSELDALDTDTLTSLIGLLAPNGMERATERQVSLASMTRVALDVLDHDPDGFFLMIEASQPDWRGHGNEDIEEIQAEMLDLDAAIGETLEFQTRHPETLILVVADHETGGLSILTEEAGEYYAGYTTGNHTGQMISSFASGPGADRFGGMKDNHEIGELLFDAVRGR